MTEGEAVFYAIGAGLAVSILDYAALHRTPPIQRPATFTDPPYLFKFFGHPLIGGLLARALYGSGRLDSPLVAVIVGAAAPPIVRTMVRSGAEIARVLLRTASETGPSQKDYE